MGSPYWFLEVKIVSLEEWRTAHYQDGSVYFIHDRDRDQIKIGHSRDPWRRIRTLQTGNSGELYLVGVMAAPKEIEKSIHWELYNYKKRGEWFTKEVLRWLEARTKGNLLKRCVCARNPCQVREVWWQWNEETKKHDKYLFDRQTDEWLLAPSETKEDNQSSQWKAPLADLLKVVK
jgi:T5orf172 domain